MGAFLLLANLSIVALSSCRSIWSLESTFSRDFGTTVEKQTRQMSVLGEDRGSPPGIQDPRAKWGKACRGAIWCLWMYFVVAKKWMFKTKWFLFYHETKFSRSHSRITDQHNLEWKSLPELQNILNVCHLDSRDTISYQLRVRLLHRVDSWRQLRLSLTLSFRMIYPIKSKWY